MLIRMHTGVSLDGFAATPDGVPAMLSVPEFVPGESHGMQEFLEQCVAVVVGRTTFDEGHAHWSEHSVWPWEGKRVYVLTSRPLPERVPDEVVAPEGGPAGLVEQLRSARLEGDVHLLGGPRTLRAFHRLGAIDRLEVQVLPVLLGEGVPLFPLGSSKVPLRLEEQRAFPDGTLGLVYEPALDATSYR
jgi:dihydrofolate reductase